MAQSLSGIFPALTTPFEKGSVSFSKLKSNIEKYNSFDLSGYVVLGSTGEGIMMSESEGLKAIETVRASAAEGRIVIAGTGAASTQGTVDFANKAAAAGAQYGLVVTPFYYKPQMTAQALETYFRAVADQSRIPIIMYTVPKFTGLDLPLQTVLALADHPNIAGLKDSSGNLSFVSEVLKAVPPRFSLLQGHGSLLLSALMLGAKGGILALSNLAPAETAEIFRLTQQGDHAKARDIQMRLLTVNQKIVGGYGVPGIKCAMDILGYAGGDLCAPLQPVAPESKESIRKLLHEARLPA
ncbi:MAG: dihydrodipicolinate synthase family protein [Deltaproteobacteria bacterium]|nr:dihydrodipicolinate synthase family protein [Deltaproteobacteria bacterium]